MSLADGAPSRAWSAMRTLLGALRAHWPEYLMEAGLLAGFMISACAFTVVLEHPDSPVRGAISSAFLRRTLMGLAMGATAVLLIHSPWGRQSGAHMNPSVTLTFLRLRRIEPVDALFYILAQFAGGFGGVMLMIAAVGRLMDHPSVNYVATLPGPAGPLPAFVAEAGIAFVLMGVVLGSSNAARWKRLTPYLAGLLVAAFITFEAPISGMSMNPARSFASARPAGLWTYLWIYFTAPLLGMFLAAEVYLRARGAARVSCAKLHHHNRRRCIFCLSRASRGL